MSQSAIGIDLGGTNLKGIIMDADGSGRHLTRIPTQADKGGKKVLENILSLVGQLLEKEGSADRIAGVGLGTPGFVDSDGQMIGGAENLPGWNGLQILAPIRKQFGLRATAANDVTAAALAEARYGAGKGVRTMACFAMGTGIGGGIVIDGHVYKGTHGMAGEFGHIVVETNGLQCNCGLKGCVEQYASGTGIANLSRKLAAAATEQTPFVKEVLAAPDTVSAKHVYDHLENDDPVAREVHETACEMLARACGIVCNAISPDRIVLGGGVMKAGQVVVDEIKERLPNHCWPSIAERTEIVCALLGEDAGAIGAASLVFEEMPG